MHTPILTYCDGDYHYGAAVLINSLYHHGYRGRIWAGYRGDPPPWAQPLTPGDGYLEYAVAADCVVCLVKIKTDMHPSLYRAAFMSQIWDQYGVDWDGIFFFDSDIVNRCDWDFYQWWIRQGIALCGDSWYQVPANHPRRLAWLSFAEAHGFPCQRSLNYHYNGGFIGIPRQSRSLLYLWHKLIELAATAGYVDRSNPFDQELFDRYPFCPHDQTALNLVLMLIDDPLSTVGPDGMDLSSGCPIMSHAISQIKPWRKNLILSALQGMPPTLADKAFWRHTQTPIQVYSPQVLAWKKLTLTLGAGIGRFIRRS